MHAYFQCITSSPCDSGGEAVQGSHCEDEARGRSNLLISTVIARTRYEDEAIYQSNDCPIIPTVDCFVTLKQHSSFQELNHFPFLAMTVLMEEDEERGRSNLPIEWLPHYPHSRLLRHIKTILSLQELNHFPFLAMTVLMEEVNTITFLNGI